MNLKRLVLGTAAGALAVTGAQAADLPVAVEPVEYVRICDAYGAGFFYIPGTETCLKVAGRVRVDYNVYINFDDEGDNNGFFNNRGFDDSNDQGYRFRARGNVRLDARTATEFGLLRTFVDLEMTVDSLARGGATPGTDVNLPAAFIQFGGLTFGRVGTFYATGAGIHTAEQTFDLGNKDSEVNLVGYTFAFGNGFTASIALEDNTDHRLGIDSAVNSREFRFVRPGRPDIVRVGTVDDAFYGGAQIPDVVGNVRIDQGWGSAQVMAAGHYVNGITTGTIDLRPIRAPGERVINYRIEEEEYGFAVGGGIEVNVPFGNGTSVGVQGGYSHGALDYIADSPDGRGAVDAVFAANGDLELGDFFSVAGGFTTSFTPTIALAAGAGYVHMEHDTYGTSSNINANGWLTYTPVTDFLLGVGVEYRHVDDDGDGFDGDSSAEGDGFTAFFRAQRAF